MALDTRLIGFWDGTEFVKGSYVEITPSGKYFFHDRFFDYTVSEEAMYLLMKYVAVQVTEERQQQLTSRALIDNHVSDGEQLMRLEMAMLQYNTSFFQNGGNSGFFEGIVRKFLPLIIQTVTDSLQPSLQRGTQRSQN